MIDLEIGRELRLHLKRLFDHFFADKYPLEEREFIIDDLIYFINAEYVKSISFCLVERGARQVGKGYILKFEFSSSGQGISKVTNLELPSPPQVTDSSEKLVILELTDKFVALGCGEQSNKLADRKKSWGFLGSVTINALNTKKWLEADGVQVSIGDIRGN